MEIEHSRNLAADIATIPADVSRADTYDQEIGEFTHNNFTYIPMPADGFYYDTGEEESQKLDPTQFVSEDSSILKILDTLQEHPFLLVDLEYGMHLIHNNSHFTHVEHTHNYDRLAVAAELRDKHETATLGGYDQFDNPAVLVGNEIKEDMLYYSWELENKYPELADECLNTSYDERYGMITLADLNKRRVKEAIYPVVAELENRLSERIESQYPNSEELINSTRANTVGRWYKDRTRGLELHISEHTNLVEMQNIINSSTKEFRSECGFSSK